MCGIVAYKGHKNCYPILLDGLHKLEYRGYDSAGVACLTEDDKIVVTKRSGKVKQLGQGLKKSNLIENRNGSGIAHTRWATHGKPNQVNAHPHKDQSGNIVLVHNGIIENYDPIKKFLRSKKVRFNSVSVTAQILILLD